MSYLENELEGAPIMTATTARPTLELAAAVGANPDTVWRGIGDQELFQTASIGAFSLREGVARHEWNDTRQYDVLANIEAINCEIVVEIGGMPGVPIKDLVLCPAAAQFHPMRFIMIVGPSPPATFGFQFTGFWAGRDRRDLLSQGATTKTHIYRGGLCGPITPWK